MPQITSRSLTATSISRRQALRNSYMKRCSEAGINVNDAVNAEAECKNWYMKWWQGKRFAKPQRAYIPNDDGECSSNDSDTRMEGGHLYKIEEEDEDEEDSTIQYPYISSSNVNTTDDATEQLESAKKALLIILQTERSITPEDNPRFLKLLRILESVYKDNNIDARTATSPIIDDNNGNSSMERQAMDDTTWVTLQPSPHYQECLGQNAKGNDLYTLGRMSFDMFRPTNLVCSVQWTFNTVVPVGAESMLHMEGGSREQQRDRPRAVPKSLQKEVIHTKGGCPRLRTYDISTAFTVDQNCSPPLRGLMTTFGYILPDPSTPNRFSVWFTGGLIEEVNGNNNNANTGGTSSPSERWKRIFCNPEQRTLGSLARLIAARLLLGADIPDQMDEVDGSMDYTFHRPIGGHGQHYVDVLYLDHNLRIMRGHHGTIYVSTRMDLTHT